MLLECFFGGVEFGGDVVFCVAFALDDDFAVEGGDGSDHGWGGTGSKRIDRGIDCPESRGKSLRSALSPGKLALIQSELQSGYV